MKKPWSPTQKTCDKNVKILMWTKIFTNQVMDLELINRHYEVCYIIMWRILLIFLLYGPSDHFVPFLGTKGWLQHSSFQIVFYSKIVTFLKIPNFLLLLPLYRYSQTRTVDSFLLHKPSVSPSAATDLCCSSYLRK